MTDVSKPSAAELAGRVFKKPRKPGVFYVSASQLKNWLACLRMWAYEKIDRIERPTTKKQGHGHDSHAVLEDWLTKAIEPPDTPAGRTVKQVIKYFPAPMQAEVRCEEEIDGQLPGFDPNVEPTGFVDVADFRDPNLAVVDDLKTTSDARWAMTKEELAEDPQAVLYAAWAKRERGTRFVKVRWVYSIVQWPKDGGPPKMKGSRVTEHVFDTESPEWAAAYAKIANAANAIARARATVKRAVELPGNGSACDNYGGCHFLKICPISDLEKVLGIMEHHIEAEQRRLDRPNKEGEDPVSASLLEQIHARKKSAPESAATPAPAPAAPAATPAPTPAPAAETKPSKPVQGSLMDRIGQAGASKGVNPGDKKPAPAAAAPAPAPTPAPEAPAAAPQSDMLASLAAKKAAKASAQAETKAAEPEKPTADAVIASAQAEADKAVETKPAEPAPEAPKKSNGKRAKSEPGDGTQAGPFALAGLAVLFDCIFEKRLTTDVAGVHYLADLLKPIEEEVAKTAKVAHWGLVPFAEGQALLAHAFENFLEKTQLSGVIYVDTCTKSACAVKDVLRRRASIVIQGQR